MASSKSPSNCWDCEQDSTGKLKQMFVDIVQARRIQQGQSPAARPVFLKPHGIAHGTLEIMPKLPKELRVGIFAMKSLPTWVRFSSDTVPASPDLRTTCGIGIKVFDVPGKKLLGDGETHDFLMQNHPVFFVDTAKDMCEFTRAGVVGGDYEPYLKTHKKTDEVLKAMAKVESSVLTATYWSVLPYSFGKGRYVKYKLEPESPDGHIPPPGDANYLAADLQRRLLGGEARFRFMVQFRKAGMPLDEATVLWDESKSPPVHVATLVLPRQDVRALGQSSYGENLAFNPWHCLEEHKPQGSISLARREVYAASAKQRHDVNGIDNREPRCPRSAQALVPVEDDCIVSAAIYPPIGVARLGNSQSEFFIGPEVTEPQAQGPDYYRDKDGALKRQAARFRVYGLNAEGKIVAELNSKEAEIHWTVHLANKKSAWYQFQLALDIPEAASAPPSLLRNSTVEDRSALTIDPGPRHISGAGVKGGKKHSFDTGSFMGKPVYLGEVQTDEAGHLIVLGGRGISASCDGTKAITFANNEGWHDDTADGPVTASVKYKGKELKVTPAWVIVGPPNYAPLQKSVRTMWDLMRDVAIQNGALQAPGRPSFQQDIRPIFERLSALQWVNAGFAASFGWKGPNNLATPEMLARLSQNNPNDAELRKTIANQFRVFDRDSWAPQPWPWLYGDAMNIPPAQTPRQHASLTNTQLSMLQQWAAGNFDADYDATTPAPKSIDEVPVASRGDMLTQAALEFCLADAFHPGCEMTWPVRTWSMYMAPFRFAHAAKDWKEPKYGAALINDTISLPKGPLGGQLPGGITRWMAVPWQTDTASCRSGYQKSYDPYVPTFWPARVPNQVLTKENYDKVMDTKLPLDERLAAFARRADWLRNIGKKGGYTGMINDMITHYGELGVVEQLPGPGCPEFPATLEVETLHHKKRVASTEAKEHEAFDTIEKVCRFAHGLKR